MLNVESCGLGRMNGGEEATGGGELGVLRAHDGKRQKGERTKGSNLNGDCWLSKKHSSATDEPFPTFQWPLT